MSNDASQTARETSKHEARPSHGAGAHPSSGQVPRVSNMNIESCCNERTRSAIVQSSSEVALQFRCRGVRLFNEELLT